MKSKGSLLPFLETLLHRLLSAVGEQVPIVLSAVGEQVPMVLRYQVVRNQGLYSSTVRKLQR